MILCAYAADMDCAEILHGGAAVDREEILEKGRRENMIRDEGVEDARNKGMHWGVVGFLFLCVAVLAYNLARGLDSSLPVAFLLGYIGCEALGRSQGELAKLVGVSRQTISSIETGQFNPTAKLALILCIALEKRFEELFYF